MTTLATAGHYLLHLGGQWDAHRVPRLAASLAYYAIISLAPLMVALVAIMSFLFDSGETRYYLMNQIREQIGPQGAQVAQDLLEHIGGAGHGWLATLTGLLAILLGASGLFAELRDALNTIWKVPPSTEGLRLRTVLLDRMRAFAMVACAGLLLTASVLVSAVISFAVKYLALSGPFLALTDLISSSTVATATFAVIYRYVPDADIEWEDVLFGSAVTGLLFVAGKMLIGLYIGRTAVGSAYGAAGSLIALLVWVYYSAQVFLLGAIITHTKSQTTKARRAAELAR